MIERISAQHYVFFDAVMFPLKQISPTFNDVSDFENGMKKSFLNNQGRKNFALNAQERHGL